MPHEFNGEAYAKASTHQKEWGNRIISEFKLKGDEHILDLGCGDGVLTSQLAALVPQGLALGIDSSESMIEVAQKLEQINLGFRLMDIERLDFENEYNLVFSNATLHWVKDHNRLLRNCYRALKNRGMLRFNFAGEGNCSNFNRIVMQATQLAEYVSYFKSFEWPWYMPSLDEYTVLLKKSAFMEFKVWGENADRFFPDSEALTRWIDQPSLVPFLECLPVQEKQTFRDYVVGRMIEATSRPDGTCFETFRRINVAAWKK